MLAAQPIDTQFFTIDYLIKTGLPPLPGSVMRISSLLADMNVSQNKIAEAISLDPIVSSRILRIANSPIYASQGSVTNLASAVTTIGNTAIQQTLTVSGLSDAFGRRVLSSPAGKEIWAHSLATSIAGTEICRIARVPGTDEVFSCGLLHDIGKLILLRADMPFYAGVIDRANIEGNLTDIEMEIFGFDHAELGAAVAEAWGLPPVVCSLIKYHHHPFDATSGLTATHVLHTADVLVNLKTNDRETSELFNDETVINFSLNEQQFDAIWNTVLLRLREILAAFE